MRKIVVILALGALLALAVIGTTGGSAVAVPPHRHCLLTSNGYVEVGKGVVEQAPHDTAFHHFHGNVHVGAPPTTIAPLFDLNAQCSSLNVSL